jgi:hypothetical protein
LLQVINRITIEEGYDEKDVQVLANTSIEEYYEFSKSLEGIYLGGYIKSCLKFGQSVNDCGRQKMIYYNAVGALRKIADESSINKQRIKDFGFEIDN